MAPRTRHSTKTFKRLRKAAHEHVHTRKGPKPMTRRDFNALCYDVLKRKAYPQKQRINQHATRVLWKELVANKTIQPKKQELWNELMVIFDAISAPEIGFQDLPFAADEDQVWHLAPGICQREPEMWTIKRIVGSFTTGGITYYEVEWANTIEPKSYIPRHLIEEFNRMHLNDVEKTYILAEAKESKMD